MKYRKKPVEIEARQWSAELQAWDLAEWMDNNWADERGGGADYDPDLAGPSGPNGEDWGRLEIDTLEGTMEVAPYDYVIRGVKGEFYACKPDIFAATYEVVE